MAAIATLDEIVGTPYPAGLLPHGGTGLCLFAAAFLGENDAVHMARARMTVYCVDTDADRLDEMEALYSPAHFSFYPADAWWFAGEMQRLGMEFDVVSVDNFTGEIEPRVHASLPLWCSLARTLVTVTIGPRIKAPVVPEGWDMSRMRRSPKADWLVLKRA